MTTDLQRFRCNNQLDHQRLDQELFFCNSQDNNWNEDNDPEEGRKSSGL